MTDIVQTNIDEILQLFSRGAHLQGADMNSCQQVDVQDMNQAMNEELSMLDSGYDGVLLGSVINPLFRLLDTASVVSAYVAKYTNGVIQYSSQMDIEHIILVTQMSDKIERVSEEIKKLRKNLGNK
jgi:hypothetical protein